MASLGYKLSYTTLITPNQTEPSPPYNTKTDGPPPFLHLLHFLTFDFSPSLAERRRAAAPAHHHHHQTIPPSSLLSPAFFIFVQPLRLFRFRRSSGEFAGVWRREQGKAPTFLVLLGLFYHFRVISHSFHSFSEFFSPYLRWWPISGEFSGDGELFWDLQPRVQLYWWVFSSNLTFICNFGWGLSEIRKWGLSFGLKIIQRTS